VPIAQRRDIVGDNTVFVTLFDLIKIIDREDLLLLHHRPVEPFDRLFAGIHLAHDLFVLIELPEKDLFEFFYIALE